jgi:predicted nucleic acid-binding protein
MTGSVDYLDGSALVKLVVAEAGSAELRAWLRGRDRLASCALVRTEVPRAVRHLGPAALASARRVIAAIDLITVDERLLDTAAMVEPEVIRSLDAIHLAAALALGSDLGTIVTYDLRMVSAARRLGLPVDLPT